MPPPDELDLPMPVTAPLLAFVVSNSDDIGIAIDVWSLAGGVAVARGVPAAGSVDSFFFRTGFPAAARDLQGDFTDVLYLNASSPSTATKIAPTGIRVKVSSLAWRAVGVPAVGPDAEALAALFGNERAAATSHVVSGAVANNADLSFTLPGNTLRAGYVYAINVDVVLSLLWDWSGGRLEGWSAAAAAWPAGLPPEGALFNPLSTMTVAARTASAPLLYAHAPPYRGSLTVTPDINGTALITDFSFSSTPPEEWADGDAGSLDYSVALDAGAVAGALLSITPRSPSTAAALATIAAGRGAEATSATLASLSSAAASDGSAACEFLDDGDSDATPRSSRALLPSTALFARSARAAGASPKSACVAAAAALAIVLRGSGGVYARDPSLFYFRVDASAGAASGYGAPPFSAHFFRRTPANLSYAPISFNLSATIALSSALSSPALWPGAPLAPPTSSHALSAAASPPAYGDDIAGTRGGRVVFFVLCVDGDGAVGVAALPFDLAPAAAGGSGALVSALVASAAAGASTSPASALLRISVAGALLTTSPSVSGASAMTTSLITSSAAAVASLQRSAAAEGVDGVAIEDGSLASVTTSLASLTSNSAALNAGAVAAAVNALTGLLDLSTPAANASALGSGGTAAQPLPLSVGTAALTTLANVVNASGVGSTGLGGVTPAVAASVDGALASLASAVLRSAAPGDAPVTLMVGGAQAGATDFCGSSLAMTTARVGALGAGLSVPPGYGGPTVTGQAIGALPVDSEVAAFSLASATLPPCAGSSGVLPSSEAAARANVPASIAALAPPPTLRLSRSTIASLQANATGGGSVDVRIVQWGVSPFNESAGLGAIGYANPASSSQSTASFSARRAADIMATHVGGAAAGAQSAMPAAPTRVTDLLPSRPLDSRVVSISVSAGGVPVTSFADSPVYVTVPLRDLSVMSWDSAAGAPGGVDVGQAAFETRLFNLTCPTAIQTPAVGSAYVVRLVGPPSAVTRAWAASNATTAFPLSAALAKGVPAYALLDNITTVGFTATLSLVSGAAPLDTGTLAVGAGSSIGGGAALVGFGSENGAGTGASVNGSTRGPVVGTSALTYVFSIDCGMTFGRRSVVCGPGSSGRTHQVVCPAVTPVASCLWFDTTAGAWSSDGCRVVRVTATAVTCACSHLTDFAVRFAALEKAPSNVFAVDMPLERSTAYSLQTFYLLLFFTLALVAAGGTIRGAIRDADAAPLYTAALASRSAIRTLAKKAATAHEASKSVALQRHSSSAHDLNDGMPTPAWFVDRLRPYEPPLEDDAPGSRLLEGMQRKGSSRVTLGSPAADDWTAPHAGPCARYVHTAWSCKRSAAVAPASVGNGGRAAVGGVESAGISEILRTPPALPPTAAQLTLSRLYARLTLVAAAPAEAPGDVFEGGAEASVGEEASSESDSSSSASDSRTVQTRRRGRGGAGASAGVSWWATAAPLVRSRARWRSPLAAIEPLTDLREPRPLRWALAVGLGAQSTLFICAWSYTFLYGTSDGTSGVRLPNLSFIGVLVLAGFALMLAAPLHFAWAVLLRSASLSEWGWRFPHIIADAARRDAAQALLGTLPLSVLRRAHARLESLSVDAALDRALQCPSQDSASFVSPTSSPAPAPAADGERAAVTDTSSKAPKAARASDSTQSVASVDDDDDAMAAADAALRSGWADPPAWLVAHAAPLLRMCGRHPSQRRAFICASVTQSGGAVALELRRAMFLVSGGVQNSMSSRASVAPAPPSAPPSAVLAAAEAVVLAHAWSADVNGAGAGWWAREWRICDFDASRDTWEWAALTVGAICRAALHAAHSALAGAKVAARHAHAFATGRPIPQGLRGTRRDLAENGFDDAPSEEDAIAFEEAAERAARAAELVAERAELNLKIASLRAGPPTEAAAAQWAALANAKSALVTADAMTARVTENSVAVAPAPDFHADDGQSSVSSGSGGSSRSGELSSGGSGDVVAGGEGSIVSDASDVSATVATDGTPPWLPRGCRWRTAIVWFAFGLYVAFAAYYTLLWGLVLSSGPLGGLIATAFVAALGEWFLVPAAHAALGAACVTRLLPHGLGEALAWIPIVGSVTGARDARRIAALVVAVRALRSKRARAAGRAALIREAAGGALALPLRLALADAATLASAHTLPLRHVPAWALAHADNTTLLALTATDSTSFVALDTLPSDAQIAAAQDLKILRARQALIVAIWEKLDESTRHGLDGWRLAADSSLRRTLQKDTIVLAEEDPPRDPPSDRMPELPTPAVDAASKRSPTPAPRDSSGPSSESSTPKRAPPAAPTTATVPAVTPTRPAVQPAMVRSPTSPLVVATSTPLRAASQHVLLQSPQSTAGFGSGPRLLPRALIPVPGVSRPPRQLIPVTLPPGVQLRPRPIGAAALPAAPRALPAGTRLGPVGAVVRPPRALVPLPRNLVPIPRGSPPQQAARLSLSLGMIASPVGASSARLVPRGIPPGPRGVPPGAPLGAPRAPRQV